MADKKHVSHVKSKTLVAANVEDRWLKGAVEIDGELKSPKLPTADDLVEGEIAINFAEGVETISHKNSEGNIVTYPNSNVLEQDEEVIAAALAKHEMEISSSKDESVDNEEIIAAAINAIVGQTGPSTDVISENFSLVSLRNDVDEISESVDTIDEVTAAAINKVVGGDVDKIDAEMNLSALKKSTDTIDLVTAAAIASLKQDIDALDGENVNARVTVLEGKAETFAENDETMSGEIDTLQSDVETLQGDVSTAKSNITTLQGNVSTLQSNMTTAQGNITTLQGNVSSLETKTDTTNTNLSTLKTDTEADLSQIDEVSAAGIGKVQSDLIARIAALELRVLALEQNS